MPRDGSGNFDLEAGNPVVPGTTIATTWANPTLDDIAQGLSDSLDRFGRGGMEAPFRLGDGSESLPGVAFTLEPSTGMYREAQGILGFSGLGTQQLKLDGNIELATFVGNINVADGVVGAPSLGFTDEPNSGIYRASAGVYTFVALGGSVMRINQDLVEYWTDTAWARFMPPVGNGFLFQAQEILQTVGNGSWDPAASPDCDLVHVQIVGGGGGGGGASVQGTNVVACGSGGGGGAYNEIFQTVGPNSTITGPVAYIIGARGLGGVNGGLATTGGTSVWNTDYTAGGGLAGRTSGLVTLAVDAVFGASGSTGGTKGTLGIGQKGGPGSKGLVAVAGGVGRAIGGAGGSSHFGGGAAETPQFAQNDQGGTEASATSYGAGGGGGAAGGVATGVNNGGNAAPGVIILSKYKKIFGTAP